MFGDVVCNRKFAGTFFGRTTRHNVPTCKTEIKKKRHIKTEFTTVYLLVDLTTALHLLIHFVVLFDEFCLTLKINVISTKKQAKVPFN